MQQGPFREESTFAQQVERLPVVVGLVIGERESPGWLVVVNVIGLSSPLFAGLIAAAAVETRRLRRGLWVALGAVVGVVLSGLGSTDAL